MNLVEVKNIVKVFGTLSALNDVSFSIKKGEIFALVGESGCGKTTLSRLILRLIEPDAGAIYFKGRDIFELKKSELRKVRADMQIVFQDPVASLNPKIKLRDAVAEPLIVHKYCEKVKLEDRINELFELVGLDKTYLNRYPHEISGGEAQRVCIARSIALNPEFLVLDEPVSSIDYDAQDKIIKLLLDIKKKKDLTYLFITHDLWLAKKIADRIAVMKDGKIIETGQAAQVLRTPKSEYTKLLIESAI